MIIENLGKNEEASEDDSSKEQKITQQELLDVNKEILEKKEEIIALQKQLTEVENEFIKLNEKKGKLQEKSLQFGRNVTTKEVQEKQEDIQISNLKLDVELKRKNVELLKENIENANQQKRQYTDILGQEIEYVREQWMSGEAKIISNDAQAYTNLWKELPVNPLVISPKKDFIVMELKKKNYSDENIKKIKEKIVELNNLRKNITEKIGYSNLYFARSNDIDYPSFPYISVGHGGHYFNNSLLGKRMTLGELFDNDIKLKSEQLKDAEKELLEIENKLHESLP